MEGRPGPIRPLKLFNAHRVRKIHVSVVAMVLRVLLFLFLFLFLFDLAASDDNDLLFNGFRGTNLIMVGTATITSDGLLQLTNATRLLRGYALYPFPLHFRGSPAVNPFSFSSTLAFGIVSVNSPFSGGNGIAFVLSPSADLRSDVGSQFLGILNPWTNGDPTNHLLAVELDTVYNPEFDDIHGDHVGIDVNSMRSITSYPAGYFADGNGEFKNLTLTSGEATQVWVEYDSKEMRLNVTLSPLGVAKPSIPLLSCTLNLSEVIRDQMYVGFSSSTFLASHYILGWSFKMNGKARPLDISVLPALPRRAGNKRSRLALALSVVSLGALVLGVIAAGVILLRRKIKFSELREDWEVDYVPHRFSYRDLHAATRGFQEKELLGTGGFGKVYRGVLPSSKAEVAVKRVSHGSRQGMKEFIAEIASMGRLRHRNLVQLLGYCRRKGELLLVYDYMPNGSLDKLLFLRNSQSIDWKQRLRIIKGVASGLLYLHEEWEQVVIHRDIKASNVLLDRELNGRLGDFGLARLYDHGGVPQTTHLAGTLGYLAPELAKAGKASKVTDVFAFGVFLLEVACGRRPVEPRAAEEEAVLVDWVLACWNRGAILDAADARLGECEREEVELVMRLGLMCCDPVPTARPSIRRLMQYLDGDAPPPAFASDYMNARATLATEIDASMPQCSADRPTASILSGGR